MTSLQYYRERLDLMFSHLKRHFSKPGNRRRKNARQFWVEGLESRALMTLTAINVPGLTVVSQPVVVNGEMFFVGKDAAHGTQLWDTNGSASGTTQLTDGEDKVGGIYPSDLTALGGTLYFIASNSDGAGEQIWKSDGTVKGTALVTNRSTGGGTYGYLYPSDLAAFNGKLYFAGMHPSDGYQLFTTDGTSAGTAMVKDIAGPPGTYGLPGSYPSDLTAAGGLLYFSATDTSHGTQLWATDGTAAGTALMTTGNAARGGTAPQFLTADGGTLYFTGFSPSTGTQRNGFQLWASDGTQATTEQLTTGGAQLHRPEPAGPDRGREHGLLLGHRRLARDAVVVVHRDHARPGDDAHQPQRGRGRRGPDRPDRGRQHALLRGQ